ncbi:FIST N-terminal domain-containing protein [Oscillatoria sp. CS-180]|uniref:FIST signal transduction protein n=1 Tax=Oscillatoria sp. CS-180 TaxID=3021720 RepID=UPI00232A94BF|nr:FIST N-terminal domain-containing protein [Oscillatoria sp. CS-180]MDB9528060.1 FIST N-terminal domain-containing protein [Oscillatoria sp. CS-180]
MFKVAVGHSIDPDSEAAVEEIIAQCQDALAGETPKAGILLSAIDFEHAVILNRICETFPGIALIGGTTVGEMSSEMGFQEDSLTLMLFCSDVVDFKAGLGSNVTQDVAAATHQAVSSTQADNIKLCYVVGEGIGVDGVAVIDGLRTALGKDIPIFGGLAGDDWQFKETYQFFGNQVLRNAVTVLTFSGNLLVSCGVATGQHPIGHKGTVTESIGSTLHKVDGQSVKVFYERYFGNALSTQLAGGSWGGAVAVFETDEDGFYVRSPSHQDEISGSIDYFGNIPEQSKIQFTETNTEDLLSAAEEALRRALDSYGGTSPSAALIVSCSSRMKLLGTRACEEHQIAQTILGNLPNIGFHAYGEICPLSKQGKAFFHNETFTAVLIGTC